METIVENGTVGVPKGFYLKEAQNEYRYWQEALARELYQNSIDAMANTIKITFDAESRIITVCDDGHGMTLDILQNKLLRLGGTYKKQENATGGLGNAKKICFFAHPLYSIHTGNLYVEGHDDVFSITRIDEEFDGTKIQITIAKGENYERNTEAFTNVAEKIETSCIIMVDGRNIQCKHKRGEFLKEVEGLGSLYSTKATHYPDHIGVRINGIWMHDWYIGESLRKAEMKLTLELEQASVDCLVNSRDDLKWDTKHKANSFIEKLTIDRITTLRPDKVEIVATVPGESSYSVPDKDIEELEYWLDTITPEMLGKIVKIATKYGTDPKLATSRVISMSNEMDEWDRKSYLKFVGYKASFITKCEKHELQAMRTFLTTKKARTIATIWTETIKQVLLDNSILDGFNTGFMVDDEKMASYFPSKESTIVSRDAEGEFVTEGEIRNERVFLLNVYKLMKKYGLSDRKQLGRKLRQMAVHEVTHITESYHHEDFTSRRERVEENTWKSDRIYDKIAKVKK
jgi:hypothetical protein